MMSREMLLVFCVCVSRNFADTENDNVTVSFDELQGLLSGGGVKLIDVRNGDEIQNDGKIPGAVNIPLAEFPDALKLNAQEFSGKYGISKPNSDDSDVILTCRSGRRAGFAYDAAKEAGFTRFRIYQGSFNDWVANGGTVLKNRP